MTGRQLFEQYQTNPGIWDEMCRDNDIRTQYTKVFSDISDLPVDLLLQKDKLAGELFMNQGITFTVYSDEAGIEKIFPFDIIPRILTGAEWDHIQHGITVGPYPARHYATPQGTESFLKRHLFTTADTERSYHSGRADCFLSALYKRGFWHQGTA
jgi:hypothetical protein